MRRGARAVAILLVALATGCSRGDQPGGSAGGTATEATEATTTGATATGAAGGPAGTPAVPGAETPSGPLTVQDAAGRTLTLDRPAQRIVSLVPSVTLTLHALEGTELLVGRTDFDREEWIAALPSVGGGLEPNLEALVALRPDLVIRFEGNQDRRTPARLDDLGIPHLGVRPDRVADALATITLVGRVSGLDAEAEALLGQVRAALGQVEAAVRELPRRRVAYVLGGTPPWVAGPGTYIHELVELAGGDNVFGELDQLYAPVSPEEIRSRAIEVVLVSGADTFDRALAPEARIEEVDARLEIPGPHLAESARRLAELIHGRSFPPLPGFENP